MANRKKGFHVDDTRDLVACPASVGRKASVRRKAPVLTGLDGVSRSNREQLGYLPCLLVCSRNMPMETASSRQP